MAILLLLVLGGAAAGAFGALLGLGGGVLIVPLLTLGFGLDFRDAVAISLLAVVTTSSASAAVYLERRVADLRLGMRLELATAVGGVVGALVAFALEERMLAAIFALMLTLTALSMVRRAISDRRAQSATANATATPTTTVMSTAAATDTATVMDTATATAAGAAGPVTPNVEAGEGYVVRRLPLGLALSGLAGVASALLGIGGGIVKVPAMHLVMGVPLRIATATSNLMMGVTASASAVLYLLRGSVDPYVAGPVVAGVFIGATAASRVAPRVPLGAIRLLFILVLAYVALEMAARAAGGSLFGV